MSQLVRIISGPELPESGQKHADVTAAGELKVAIGTLALPTGAATEATLATVAKETTLQGVRVGTDRIPAQGPAVMASSTPVTMASNQTAIPVSGTVTANAAQSGTWNVGLLAGSQTVGKVDQGVGGSSAWKVDGSAVVQPVSGTFWQATQPVSAASLPLPTGAAADATLAALATQATLVLLALAQGADATTARGPVAMARVTDADSGLVDGTVQALQMTPRGRMRVATFPELTGEDMFESMLSDSPPAGGGAFFNGPAWGF